MKLITCDPTLHDFRPLVMSVYGSMPELDVKEFDAFCVFKGNDLVGFGNLMIVAGVSMGMTDWISLSSSLSAAERELALRLMVRHLSERKSELELDGVMIHSPYQEIRSLQREEESLHEGETVSRLSFRP